MINIQDYIDCFQRALLNEFGDKVCYIGLQGSYLRGDANEHSDMDMMVILESLSVEDMNHYRTVIEQLGDFDKACGFICSKKDMQHWNPLEICQLLYTTKDLYGSVSDFVPEWTMTDQVNYIKLSLNNLYHALCHGYIHGNKECLATKLIGYYKSAYFILQNTHFVESGEFVLSKSDLLKRLHGKDREVLKTFIELLKGKTIEFEKHFALLHSWCQEKLSRSGTYKKDLSGE